MWDPAIQVPSDEVLRALITLTASEPEVSIAASASFAGAFPADDGDGVLGVTGICGRGWNRDGSRVAEDPCSAATPLTEIDPDFPAIVPFALYPQVEGGWARAGHYQVEIPLGLHADRHTGTLRLHVEIASRDPARLPAWSETTSPLRVSLEEAPRLFFDDGPPPLTIRIEDPYRRILAERSLAEILAEGNDPPSFELPVPSGAWRIVALAAGSDGRFVPCGTTPILVEAGQPQGLTLVLDHLGADGTCPNESP